MTLREVVHALQPRLNLRVVDVLEEPPLGWQEEVGYISEALLECHPPLEGSSRKCFVCGPPPMIAVVERTLYQLGVPMARFHTELFDLA